MPELAVTSKKRIGMPSSAKDVIYDAKNKMQMNFTIKPEDSSSRQGQPKTGGGRSALLMANRNGFSPPGVCDSFMIYADF